MALTEEEQRALDYRKSLLTRERARKASERALKGDQAARKALDEAWHPLLSTENR